VPCLVNEPVDLEQLLPFSVRDDVFELLDISDELFGLPGFMVVKAHRFFSLGVRGMSVGHKVLVSSIIGLFIDT